MLFTILPLLPPLMVIYIPDLEDLFDVNNCNQLDLRRPNHIIINRPHIVSRTAMSRRDANRTDSSIISVAESLRFLMASSLRYIGEETGLTYLDETQFRQFSTEQKLSHMLSTKSYLTTSSSSAGRNEQAAEFAELGTYREIGKGQCGIVWSLAGTTDTFKSNNPQKEDQLYNNYVKHYDVRSTFERALFEFKKDINIPAIGPWHTPDNDRFWNHTGQLFPRDFQPTYGFISERIFPVPLPVREAVFDAFAPKTLRHQKQSFLTQNENKDCLIRIYLGRRKIQRTAFRLRNFDLMVDEMEWLRLDTDHFAQVMARTLAFLHWSVKIDANDVEFVLGSSPKNKLLASVEEYKHANCDTARNLGQEYDFRRRSLGIWLLDFDQCQYFEEDESGLKQLERAFFFNDPYYPRPYAEDAKDQKLWETFKTTYLFTSSRLTNSLMPEKFIAAVEQEGAKRAAGGSLFR